MLTTVFTHRDSCRVPDKPPLPHVGRFGDRLIGCPSCGALALDPTPEADLPDPPTLDAEPDAPGPKPMRWRCVDHNHGVDWRGRGCPQCSAERTRPRKKNHPTERTDR